MTKLESKNPNREKMIWECECGCCYLRINWDNDDPECRFLYIDTYHCPHTIKTRLKTAWRALKGYEVGHAEVVLDDPCVTGLAEFFVQDKFKTILDTHAITATVEMLEDVAIRANNPTFNRYIQGER